MEFTTELYFEIYLEIAFAFICFIIFLTELIRNDEMTTKNSMFFPVLKYLFRSGLISSLLFIFLLIGILTKISWKVLIFLEANIAPFFFLAIYLCILCLLDRGMLSLHETSKIRQYYIKIYQFIYFFILAFCFISGNVISFVIVLYSKRDFSSIPIDYIISSWYLYLLSSISCLSIITIISVFVFLSYRKFHPYTHDISDVSKPSDNWEKPLVANKFDNPIEKAVYIRLRNNLVFITVFSFVIYLSFAIIGGTFVWHAISILQVIYLCLIALISIRQVHTAEFAINSSLQPHPTIQHTNPQTFKKLQKETLFNADPMSVPSREQFQATTPPSPLVDISSKQNDPSLFSVRSEGFPDSPLIISSRFNTNQSDTDNVSKKQLSNISSYYNDIY